MTAKKCTRKSDARAKLLFYLFNLFDVLVAVAVVASFKIPFYKRVYMFSYGVDGFSSGGVLPYMGYIGMCRCEGYGFSSSLL